MVRNLLPLFEILAYVYCLAAYMETRLNITFIL